jgi:tRNA guanosine-2'-O-methyltransferase
MPHHPSPRPVALEQSEQSQALPSFSLPRKTALLLGNERQGIPADLLAAGPALVDACVEIPQVSSMIRGTLHG